MNGGTAVQTTAAYKRRPARRAETRLRSPRISGHYEYVASTQWAMTPRPLQRPAASRPHAPFAPLRRAAWLAALCVGISSPASAQDSAAGGSDFRLDGFGTLGVVDVVPHDGWGFRRGIDQTGHLD